MLGRTIPDFEVLDSTIAGALQKLLTADFKRRVQVEAPKITTIESKKEDNSLTWSMTI